MTDAWDLTVNEGVAQELAAKAMRIKRPVRDQRKVNVPGANKLANKEIDAMDVLLGLAKYN